MKKIHLILITCLALASPALAQTGTITINQLPMASTLNGTESIPVWQSGATKQLTPAMQRTFDLASLSTVAVSGQYSDLAGLPTLGTISGITVGGTASTGYVLTVTGSGTYAWSAPTAGTITIGSNATGVLTYSSGVMNFANPVNGASGLVVLDTGGNLVAGLLGNYIGSTVQGYNAATTFLGNAVTGTGSLVKNNTPTFVGTVSADAFYGDGSSLSGTAYGLAVGNANIATYTENSFFSFFDDGTGFDGSVNGALGTPANTTGGFPVYADYNYGLGAGPQPSIFIPEGGSFLCDYGYVDASLDFGNNNSGGAGYGLVANGVTFLDPINRQLYASDGTTVGLDWFEPGYVNIEGGITLTWNYAGDSLNPDGSINCSYLAWNGTGSSLNPDGSITCTSIGCTSISLAGNPVVSKASSGTVTLSGGTATVSYAGLSASSKLYLGSGGATGSNAGAVFVSSRTNGTGFVITSTNGSDTQVVSWEDQP